MTAKAWWLVCLRVAALGLVLGLVACGTNGPADPILGTWEYDIAATQRQTPRRAGEDFEWIAAIVWESPISFGADGNYWEGDVPRTDRTPPPEGRWWRREDGCYVVEFTKGERAGRRMVFRMHEESLICISDEPRHSYYCREAADVSTARSAAPRNPPPNSANSP